MELLTQIRDELAYESNVRKSYIYRFLMNFQLWWPIWVIYLLKERGLSLTQITLLDTPYFVLMVLAEVPTGAVADRLGRKTALIFSSLLFAVAVFVFGIADNYFVILISYSAWGLATTFQSGADTALLYDSLKQIGREDNFQRINGRLWAITSAAALLAILLGAPLASATSLTVPILVSAGICLLGVPVAATMHEPRQPREEGADSYVQMVRTGIREAWAHPSLRYIILFSGVVWTCTFGPMIFLQPFLQEHDVGIGGLGFWQAPVRAAGIVAALLVARFVGRVGERGAFFAMPLALAGCYFALAGIDHLWAYLAFLPVGMVAGIQNPVLATYVNRRIPSERRATMLSVQAVVASLLTAVMEPLGGFVADQLGLQALFLMFAAISLVVATGILVLWQRAEAAGEASTSLLADASTERITVS